MTLYKAVSVHQSVDPSVHEHEYKCGKWAFFGVFYLYLCVCVMHTAAPAHPSATIFSSHIICSRLLLSKRYRKIIKDNNAFKREHKEEYLAKVREGETTEAYVPVETPFDKSVR